jgi:hypothetical protein
MTNELGYNVIEGTEWIVSLKKSVAVSEVCGVSEEKYLKTRFRSADILLYVTEMIYFKSKLQ